MTVVLHNYPTLYEPSFTYVTTVDVKIYTYVQLQHFNSYSRLLSHACYDLLLHKIGRKCNNRSLIKMYARITVFCVSVMQYPKRMCCIRPYQYIVSIHSLESIHTLESIHIYDGINTYLRINTYLGINTYIGINTYLRTVDSKVIPAV